MMTLIQVVRFLAFHFVDFRVQITDWSLAILIHLEIFFNDFFHCKSRGIWIFSGTSRKFIASMFISKTTGSFTGNVDTHDIAELSTETEQSQRRKQCSNTKFLKTSMVLVDVSSPLLASGAARDWERNLSDRDRLITNSSDCFVKSGSVASDWRYSRQKNAMSKLHTLIKESNKNIRQDKFFFAASDRKTWFDWGFIDISRLQLECSCAKKIIDQRACERRSYGMSNKSTAKMATLRLFTWVRFHLLFLVHSHDFFPGKWSDLSWRSGRTYLREANNMMSVGSTIETNDVVDRELRTQCEKGRHGRWREWSVTFNNKQTRWQSY